MALKLYWWAPRMVLRSLLTETYFNGSGWARLMLRTGRALYNFGDELSATVVEHVTGQTVRWSSPERAELFGVGSIMSIAQRAGAEGYIWGTGSRAEQSHVEDLSSRVLAVRGPRTLASVGGLNVPVGDPGLFAAELVTRRSRRGTLLIPHFSAYSSRAALRNVRALANELSAEICEPTHRPTEVLERIAAADLVVSSSLHGLVCSHALGTPAIPLAADNTTESSFKYDDHYESLGGRYWATSPEHLASDQRRRGLVERAVEEHDVLIHRVPPILEALSSALTPLR